MRKVRRIRGKNAGQEGYVLVLVVFMLALALIALATVATNVLIDGRREKEQEMIWRGKQYVRGVRLFVRYYQMHGGQMKFPTSMDDLVKNKVGIRFMRQEYKDPMNTVDGSWRFIYVGPNGQLIGSLKQPTNPLGTNAAGAGGFGSLFGASQTGAAGTQNSSFGNSSFGNSSFGNSSFGNSSFGGSSSFGNSSFGNSSFNNNGQAQAANANPPQPASTDAQNGTDAQNTNSWGDMATPQAIANADVNATIIGGNIIGVGSKINQKSIIWYDKAKNYRQFEFIWDPAKEPVNGGTNAGVVGIPGQVPLNGASSPFGGPAGQPGNGLPQGTSAPGGIPTPVQPQGPPQQ